MPTDYGYRDRTTAPLPGRAVLGFAILLSTASAQSPAVFEGRSPTVDHVTDRLTTVDHVTDRLHSESDWEEATGTQMLPTAVAGATILSAASLPDPKEPLRQQLLLLLADSGGLPSVGAIDDALRFVDLLPVDTPPPHVSVADDGEINFFRSGPGLYVDIGFFGDGRIHFYAQVQELGVDVDGSQPFTGRSLPRDLVIPLTAAG